MVIPFGYWRANVRKYSMQWIFAIHIPVPFIVILRIYSDIGFAWHTYVFFIVAFFLGQCAGAKISTWYREKYENVSSCLFCDLITFLK